MKKAILGLFIFSTLTLILVIIGLVSDNLKLKEENASLQSKSGHEMGALFKYLKPFAHKVRSTDSLEKYILGIMADGLLENNDTFYTSVEGLYPQDGIYSLEKSGKSHFLNVHTNKRQQDTLQLKFGFINTQGQNASIELLKTFVLE